MDDLRPDAMPATEGDKLVPESGALHHSLESLRQSERQHLVIRRMTLKHPKSSALQEQGVPF